MIIEPGGDPPAVAKQPVAQATLDPFRTFAGTLGNHKRLGFRGEGFRFAEPFVTGLRVEFFSDSRASVKAWKYHPNTYDVNLAKCHDVNSAINIFPHRARI